MDPPTPTADSPAPHHLRRPAPPVRRPVPARQLDRPIVSPTRWSCWSTAASGATGTGSTSWCRSPTISRPRGYAAWNIEYRRVGDDGGGWPGTLTDVAAAVDQLAVIAAEHRARSRPGGDRRALGRRAPGALGGRPGSDPDGRPGCGSGGRPGGRDRSGPGGRPRCRRRGRARWRRSARLPRRHARRRSPTATPWRPRRCRPGPRWWPWSAAPTTSSHLRSPSTTGNPARSTS